MSGDPEWTPLAHTWSQGTPSYGSGMIGEAAYFDDKSSIILGNECSSCFWFPDLCPSGLTFSFWVKLSSYSVSGVNAYIIGNGAHTSGSYGINMCLVGDKLFTAVKNNDHVVHREY